MKVNDITVLLIDDDRQIQDAYKAAFDAFKLNIMQAMSGKEALELLKVKKPNIILLDILMPEMNGIEVLSVIKKDDELKNIPVLVISNSVKEEDMEAAEKLGALEYIIKSNIGIGELIDKVKKYAN